MISKTQVNTLLSGSISWIMPHHFLAMRESTTISNSSTNKNLASLSERIRRSTELDSPTDSPPSWGKPSRWIRKRNLNWCRGLRRNRRISMTYPVRISKKRCQRSKLSVNSLIKIFRSWKIFLEKKKASRSTLKRWQSKMKKSSWRKLEGIVDHINAQICPSASTRLTAHLPSINQRCRANIREQGANLPPMRVPTATTVAWVQHSKISWTCRQMNLQWIVSRRKPPTKNTLSPGIASIYLLKGLSECRFTQRRRREGVRCTTLRMMLRLEKSHPLRSSHPLKDLCLNTSSRSRSRGLRNLLINETVIPC